MRIGLIVMAKAPRPGWAKTRLCPPLSRKEAARVAEACLRDTLAAAVRTPGTRPVVALDGGPGPWLPQGVQVIEQRGDGLDERLAAAFNDVGGPALLIGMDTPQVTPGLLSSAVGQLMAPGVDAVLGPAEDGGWWCLGLRKPDPRVFLGVPMSTAWTGSHQYGRLRTLGLRTDVLLALRDVDVIGDALEVAAQIPGSQLSAEMARLGFVAEMAAG